MRRGGKVAHVAKYARSQLGGLTRHFERATNENGEYLRFSNEEIDITRIHLNYNLAPERNQLEFISQRCSEVRCHKRDDVKVMCSWIVTAPRDLKTKELTLTDDELPSFFREVYKFLNDRYGGGTDANVISAHVHMDETTPHMHYAFVPVTRDKKKGHEKVSAKEILTRQDLKTFHQDLEGHMTLVFGREIGILNGATQGGNRTKEELIVADLQNQQEQLRAENSDLDIDVKNALILHEEVRGEVLYLKREKDKLEGQITALEGRIITKDEIANLPIKITRGIFAREDAVAMRKIDYDSLVATALASLPVKTAEELEEVKKKLKAASEEAEKIKPLERTVSALRQRVSDLETEKQYRKLHGNREAKEWEDRADKAKRETADVIARINKVLKSIPKEAADLFIDQWKWLLEQEELERQRQKERDDDWDLDR